MSAVLNKYYVKNGLIRVVLKLFLFLSVFLYFFPIEFKAIPFSLVRIIQILGLIYLLCSLFGGMVLNRALIKYYVGAIAILVLGVWATSLFNDANDYSLTLTRSVYVFLYSFSAFWIWYLVKRTSTFPSIYTLLEWIVIATIVHSVISFAFFLHPDLLSKYNNLIVTSDFYSVRSESFAAYRLIGLSQNVQYANAAAHYGIVLWALILLYKRAGSYWSRHKLLYYIIVTLFCIAGIFSGRTFFLILLLTVVYVYILNRQAGLVSVLKESVILFVPLFVLASIMIGWLFISNKEAMDWAFELFINIFSDKGAHTDSTDTLQDMLAIVPNSFHTWLIGDGKGETGSGFYMNTDVGYLRSIFYWGVIGTLIYYFVQYKYYRVLKAHLQNADIGEFVYMILLFFFVYNIKEFWRPEPFLVLFLIATLRFSYRQMNYNYR